MNTNAKQNLIGIIITIFVFLICCGVFYIILAYKYHYKPFEYKPLPPNVDPPEKIWTDMNGKIMNINKFPIGIMPSSFWKQAFNISDPKLCKKQCQNSSWCNYWQVEPSKSKACTNTACLPDPSNTKNWITSDGSSGYAGTIEKTCDNMITYPTDNLSEDFVHYPRLTCVGKYDNPGKSSQPTSIKLKQAIPAKTFNILICCYSSFGLTISINIFIYLQV